MKKKFLLVIVLSFSLIFGFIACNKDNEDENQPEGNTPTTTELTEADKQEIITSYNNIAAVADPILMSDNPIEQLNQNLQFFSGQAGVENVWIADNSLFVKFTKGNVVSWYVTPDFIVPPYIGGSKEISDRTPVGNTKVCLINQVFTDERFTSCIDVINHLEEEFTDNEFEVDVKNGSEANLSLYANDMSAYGTIFYISHGSFDGTRTWLFTGEEADEPDGIMEELLNDLLTFWLEGKISVGSITEKRDGNMEVIPYYTFSDKYVESSYSAGDFPNSLIYLVACQSFKSTTQLAEAYHGKGAGVIIGWDETNCIGHTTGQLIMDYMLGGLSVEEAISLLPDEAKVSDCVVDPGANLTFYPPSGKDIYLVDENDAEVFISSHENNQVYTDRIQILEGYVEGFTQITNGTVEVNGITTTIKVTGSTQFSQPILINDGDNTIIVNCYGEAENGLSVFASTVINIVGELPILDIFTELRWNTDESDVDFHLLPPGADMDDLWTDEDCYYSNSESYWGGFLDVDDTDGYGPEHITVPTVTQDGIYRLFIHYYDDDGAGTSQAYVDVSTQNGEVHSFGPYALTNDGSDNAGDVWEVCTFEFPSKTITPVNQFYNLGKKKSNQNIPAKK